METMDSIAQQKGDTLLKKFEDLGYDLEHQLSQEEILSFLNKNSKSGFDQKFSSKLFQVLGLEESQTITVEDFISYYIQFEDDLEQNSIELKNKILQRDFEFEYIINLLEPRIICYRNPELQEKIKKIIPQRTEGLTSEQYVKILLKWFKKDYFSWCNKPKCPKCGQNDKNLTVITYKGTPNEQEKKYLAYKTEVYKCNQCQIEIRFARCNNPIILLETKTGRCSEWSNLFGAILYTCGFKVRLINNFEDHVWNEFYNEEEQRWIHLDSCEEAYDTPLVYEQGWGRVMTFILGMSDDGLVEVTPRYVKDWKIVSERRSEKMVIKLGNILEKWNQKWSEGFTNEQKKNIENRRKSEIENFEKKIKNDLNDNKIKDDEKIGRQSGSLEWRKNRGEI